MIDKDTSKDLPGIKEMEAAEVFLEGWNGKGGGVHCIIEQHCPVYELTNTDSFVAEVLKQVFEDIDDIEPIWWGGDFGA